LHTPVYMATSYVIINKYCTEEISIMYRMAHQKKKKKKLK
jgi:hypothetical protein